MRNQGKDARNAVIKAGCLRFRSILLTSLTTFAGLTPMLLESIDSTSIEQASLWFQIQQKKPDPPAWNFYLVFKQVLPVFPGRRLPDQCDRLTAVTM
jgi:hypothetical protein